MKKEVFKNIALLLAGNFVLAFGIGVFILPFDILSGGVAGIAIILSPLVSLDKEFLVNILVFTLFIVGWLFLGRGFAIKTALSSIAYPAFLNIISRFLPTYEINPMLASLYGGLLCGIGIGMVMKTGASTGGMDIPPLILNKLTHIKVATLVMVIDAITVLLGLAIYGLEAVLIGFISVFATGIAIDKVLVFGGSTSKSVQIISDKYEEIIEAIHKNLDRGTTLIESYGGYTKNKKMLILVVVYQTQFSALMDLINKIDSESFVIISDATSVHGEGFTPGFNTKKI